MRSSLRPKPSEVVNDTVPEPGSRRPIGATAVTTAPPAGVTYATAAVRSPPITSSISSGQPESATASNYAIGAPLDQTGEACESATSRRQSYVAAPLHTSAS